MKKSTKHKINYIVGSFLLFGSSWLIFPYIRDYLATKLSGMWIFIIGLLIMVFAFFRFKEIMK
ncbi:MAG: hypothetical protein AABY22_16785 [Nanoarchaeota archaeon]